MKKFIFLSIALLVFASFISIQENIFTKLIKEKVDNYALVNYPEKVYVHTDKPYYSVGDDIWFSAYLVNGVTHTKSNKSNLLYAELINSNDSIIAKEKLFMNDVNTAGNFKIPKKTVPGNYLIRAYTNYMRNEKPTSFFQKEISILSLDKTKTVTKTPENIQTEKKSNSFKPDLNFYPEGGYLVNNLKSAIAIKLKNNLFNELPISISIVDNDNQFITEFTSTKFGLGLFYLEPELGKTYFALMELEGNEYRYPLPKALENGYTLNALNNGKELLINLQSNVSKGLFGTSLVIHQRGNLLYNVTQTTEKKNQTLKISNKTLQNGVIHITLFNPERKPVSERLIFINSANNKATVTITKPKDYYGRRKQVHLNLNVQNIKKENLISNLSMSVRDLNAYPEDHKAENIKTWLLLNSDLRGKIKNPGYFFEKENDRERSYLLDLIMRTNGWRRFTWQNLLYNTATQPEFKVEKGITISGKTLAMKAPYEIKSVPTRFTFFGKKIAQEPIQTSNSKGEFSYGPYIFFDSVPVLLEARLTNFKSERERDRKVLIIHDKDKKRPEIIRDSLNKNLDNKKSMSAFLNYENYLKELDSTFKQQQNVLDEIVISTSLKDEKSKRNDEMNAKTSYGGSFRRFDAADSNSGSTALDLLFNVNGVYIEQDTVYVKSFGSKTIPLIMFDEVPIDVTDLTVISASDVSFIDLLLGGEASVFTSNGAVVSIYSKSGEGYNSSKNVKRKPGIIDFKAVGFYTAKEFYAPDHINGIEEQTKADIRTTLHWVPKIKTTKTGDVSISFFTSDSKSNYLIEVEGITENGIPVYGTSKIMVE
ncbi:hypothetical protein MPF19_08480 [Polaribacter sp. Z014]|uniref:hypothetical protein n=1 Tax=Polaribacter sp. Z014 TaxID=2927126 RepID=UPI0020202F54|nr:hypothetical protein [Polaribacter sp. Z014]MCL7763446.1 hypothetical protein [Polaribacter sp. Z014]